MLERDTICLFPFTGNCSNYQTTSSVTKITFNCSCRYVPLYQRALKLNWIKILEHENKDDFIAK